MAIQFISDLHLTPDDPAGLTLFETFAADAAGGDALYVLGDLFDYWIGDDAGELLGHGPVLALLQRIADAGVVVYVMRGNRDFLLGEAFAAAAGCRLLGEPTPLRLGSRNVVLVHGDGLCTDDVEHQAFRAQVRSPTWQRAFLAKPVAERHAAARSARYRSEADKRQKSAAIMDVNQHAVEQLMRAHGADVLIHGHTHRPGVHEFDLDGRRVTRVVLGAWHDGPSVLTVDGERWALEPNPTAIGDQAEVFTNRG